MFDVFFEQYLSIEQVVMGTAFLSVCAITGVATLLLGSLHAALLVTVTVAGTALSVVGAMGAWGVHPKP